MAGNPTVKKRQREAMKREHQREKAERRAERKKAQHETQGSNIGGEDPDLAGIIPGPQPTTEEG
jgi:hypothetical protein